VVITLPLGILFFGKYFHRGEKKSLKILHQKNAEMSSRDVYGSVSEKKQRENDGVEKGQGGTPPGNPRVNVLKLSLL
jgi:hypothetical protein